jgi:hypothetical protein
MIATAPPIQGQRPRPEGIVTVRPPPDDPPLDAADTEAGAEAAGAVFD